MTSSEYEKAKKMIKSQTQTMKSLGTNSLSYTKQLKKYLEIIITIKGHAWCMDVKSERRKMAKLLANAISNV